jgi:sugar phosphate isomerase/epimerase
MDKNGNQSPDRRQFIAQSSLLTGGALVAATTPCCAALTSPLSTRPDSEPWFKISLAQWSLHRLLQAGKLDNLDFPAFTKEQCKIDAVEYVNQFFKDKAEDQKYLAELNKRCSDAGVEQVLIMVDGEGALGDSDDANRKKAVENHHKWVTAAKTLGCHSIRVNAKSSGGYQEQVKLAADGLRQLSEFAAQHDINVIVENHGGLSSNGQWLAQVIQRVNMDNCGTLPDFGNFRVSDTVEYDRYLGMAALLPFAKAVSAKSHDFDKDGNETKSDFIKMMTMVKDSGYRGYVGVEFEGSEIPEVEGVAKTRDLLIRCQKELV